VSVSLTQLAKDILEATAELVGQSRSNVIESLLRNYAAALTKDDFKDVDPDDVETEPAAAGTSAR
jgi:hypothetical protein